MNVNEFVEFDLQCDLSLQIWCKDKILARWMSVPWRREALYIRFDWLQVSDETDVSDMLVVKVCSKQLSCINLDLD